MCLALFIILCTCKHSKLIYSVNYIIYTKYIHFFLSLSSLVYSPHVTHSLMFTFNKLEYFTMLNIIVQHGLICLIYNQNFIIFVDVHLTQPFFQLPYYAECNMNMLNYETCRFPVVGLISIAHTFLCFVQLIIFFLSLHVLVYRYILSNFINIARVRFLHNIHKNNPDLSTSMAYMFFELTKNVDITIM